MWKQNLFLCRSPIFLIASYFEETFFLRGGNEWCIRGIWWSGFFLIETLTRHYEYLIQTSSNDADPPSDCNILDLCEMLTPEIPGLDFRFPSGKLGWTYTVRVGKNYLKCNLSSPSIWKKCSLNHVLILPINSLLNLEGFWLQMWLFLLKMILISACLLIQSITLILVILSLSNK